MTGVRVVTGVVIRVFVGRTTTSIGDRGCHACVCRESQYVRVLVTRAEYIRIFVGRATTSIGDRGCIYTCVCRESHYEYW